MPVFGVRALRLWCPLSRHFFSAPNARSSDWRASFRFSGGETKCRACKVGTEVAQEGLQVKFAHACDARCSVWTVEARRKTRAMKNYGDSPSHDKQRKAIRFHPIDVAPFRYESNGPYEAKGACNQLGRGAGEVHLFIHGGEFLHERIE